MNKDNSNKATIGSKTNDAMKAQLEYLASVGIITDYKPRKFGYARTKKDQFKCDYLLAFKGGEKWIVFTAASLSTDRVKTKQWDALNIKKIDKQVKKAYIVCPDIIEDRKSAYENFLRYQKYVDDKEWKSFIDGILLQSELVDLIENKVLGDKDAGSKAAKKGLNFEEYLKGIMSYSQNLERWQGNMLAVGWKYDVFLKVVTKLGIDAKIVKKIEGDTDIDDLPTYTYKDGTTKAGGPPKTDLIITVSYKDDSKEDFRISCKSTKKNIVGVHQFPTKYGVEILGLSEDSQQLLDEYVASGGPTIMDPIKAEQLKQRLAAYNDKLSQWALRGTEKDGSTIRQRADYIVTRYIPTKKGEKPVISIETIDECIQRQRRLKKGHFGTDFSWSVTSTKNGQTYPSLRVYIEK